MNEEQTWLFWLYVHFTKVMLTTVLTMPCQLPMFFYTVHILLCHVSHTKELSIGLGNFTVALCVLQYAEICNVCVGILSRIRIGKTNTRTTVVWVHLCLIQHSKQFLLESSANHLVEIRAMDIWPMEFQVWNTSISCHCLSLCLN